jgi:hypothetical protein
MSRSAWIGNTHSGHLPSVICGCVRTHACMIARVHASVHACAATPVSGPGETPGGVGAACATGLRRGASV